MTCNPVVGSKTSRQKAIVNRKESVGIMDAKIYYVGMVRNQISLWNTVIFYGSFPRIVNEPSGVLKSGKRAGVPQFRETLIQING